MNQGNRYKFKLKKIKNKVQVKLFKTTININFAIEILQKFSKLKWCANIALHILKKRLASTKCT